MLFVCLFDLGFGHLICKAIVLCYQACGQRQTTNEVHKVADGATSGFEFSMEIYGDDDDTTAIQDQQHKIEFIHLWSFSS